MKYTCLLLLCCVLMSCTSIQVTHDYDRTIDFSRYKTFNYDPNMNSGLSELDQERLFDAIDAYLINKGFELSRTPDVLIHIKTSMYQSANQSSVGVGVGGGGGNVGGGVSVGIPVGQAKHNRVIQFDVLDVDGVGLIWQAVSDAPYLDRATPDERAKQMELIVAKAFQEFPPSEEVR